MISPYIKSSIANALETARLRGAANKLWSTITPSEEQMLKGYIGDMAKHKYRGLVHSALGHGLVFGVPQGLAGGLISEGLGGDFRDGFITGVGLSPLTAGVMTTTNLTAKTLYDKIY